MSDDGGATDLRDTLHPLPGMEFLRDHTLREIQQAMYGLVTTEDEAREAAVAALRVVDRHWLRVPTVGVVLSGGAETGVGTSADRVSTVRDLSVRAMMLTDPNAREFERAHLTVDLPSGWEVVVTGPWSEPEPAGDVTPTA
jgi:hypothetical protein